MLRHTHSVVRFVFLTLILCFVSPALSTTTVPEKNPNIPWETYRMCATFHNEGCAKTADPPGPCTDMHECIAVVCDDNRPVGSCSFDMSLSWCELGMCPFSMRQVNNPVRRIGVKVAEGVARLLG
eukprot:GFKZ01002368.1.p1 GENE.GFKZ01002368.1~~GFKZ01002368.1.p1  ORF type:complete len:125 (+),score=3.93 GFKZ01002368.1:315-689(+)